jgi:hypothetical protein
LITPTRARQMFEQGRGEPLCVSAGERIGRWKNSPDWRGKPTARNERALGTESGTDDEERGSVGLQKGVRVRKRQRRKN